MTCQHKLNERVAYGREHRRDHPIPYVHIRGSTHALTAFPWPKINRINRSSTEPRAAFLTTVANTNSSYSDMDLQKENWRTTSAAPLQTKLSWDAIAGRGGGGAA